MFARAIRQHTACSRAVAASPRACRQPRIASTPALRTLTTSSDRSSPDSSPPASFQTLLPRKLLIPQAAAAAASDLFQGTTAAPAETIPGTPITVLRSVAAVRQWTSEKSLSARRDDADNDIDQGIALVPTMGALHEGHLRLVREAVRLGHDKVAVSIYVNPAQFGVAEDLDSYPQTWAGDCAALRELYEELSGGEGKGIGRELQMAVFAPPTGEMYPSGFPGQEVSSKGTFVTVTPVGELLEGAARPTFFRGVATVCMKLFNIVQPSRAFFGQKDVQQTVVVRKMVRDFHMPMEVVVVPTARDEVGADGGGDGLALSSRNVYLGARRRKVAPVLYRALRAAEEAYAGGSLDAGEILPAALKVVLDTMGEQKELPAKDGVLFQLEYISLADPDTMEEIDFVDPTKGAILSGAVKMLPVYNPQEGEDLGAHGGPPVRLIDNIILPPKE